MSGSLTTQPGIKYLKRSPRVLLVDDDSTDLWFLRSALEEQGFEVLACPSFEAGLKCLETTPSDFVVVNQGSAAFEGRSVVDRARQLDPQRGVLVLARCIDMHCYLEAMQMGALDYLEKPVRPAELARFVRGHV